MAIVVGLILAAAPASGEEIRLAVTRDTWFSEVGSEADANLGGASKLKLKSYQELSLVDLDPAPLRGRVVVGAILHLRSAGEPRLRRVTVGTIAADWVEGKSASYAPEAGASTFRHRRHPDVPWTVVGGDLCDVILNQGGSLWRSADASAPDAEGWQTVAVAPLIVAARVAGVSFGFVVFDDTGSEWTREGEKFTTHPRPNRFVASRESNRASAPYFTVKLGAADRSPPGIPTDLSSDIGTLPSGEASVSWATPADIGASGPVGFLVEVDGREVPRYLIPPAGTPRQGVRMHLRDLGLIGGSKVALGVRAVDGAGNVGQEARTNVRISNRRAKPLPGSVPRSMSAGPQNPRLGPATVAVVDELDVIDPGTGAPVQALEPGYLAANHLWDGSRRRLAIQAARNEFVGFQVFFKGPVQGLRPALTFEDPADSGIKAEFGRMANVATGRGPMPDPVVPLSGPLDLPVDAKLGGGSMLVEVYVPHGARAGEHRGKLTLRAGGEELPIDVALRVWDFDLPDVLSFLPEMNAYSLPDDERSFYRLAHRHRTALNRVPYSQRGEVAPGMAPKIDGGRLGWSAWDARFGPLFDGSAFADLPRRGVPLECFYLPLHENWPSPIDPNYNGDYWADRAFPESYRRAFVSASRQFAEHLDAKGWRGTIFQGFLNNKVDFKGGPRGWSGGSSPWLLDEPASFQDFWALRYFASAFHEGVAAARPNGVGPARIAFRADISRPQWQRDSLDGLLDDNVVGGEVRNRRRMVLDRKERDGQLVLEYGGSSAIDAPNVQGAAWCVDAWSLGLDGVIPWQTIGRAESWTTADELALFYPPRPGVDAGPVPSIRLKSYRRGQQDVEYLALLAAVEGEPRWAIGSRVREALHLAGERQKTGPGEDDAGSIRYGRLQPRDLWSLRHRVGSALSEAHPKGPGKGLDWPRPRGR